MYLITKWFGTFLIHQKRILDYQLFPKNKTTIIKKLTVIQNQEILPEEKKLAKEKNKLKVIEKRLQSLGTYLPNDPTFTSLMIKPEDYGFSRTLLHTISNELTTMQVTQKLTAPDLQIIQMVNTLDDLIHTQNLLTERRTRWTTLITPKKNLQPLDTTLSTITTQLTNQQQQIKQHITTLAPNLTSLIGPLITARLIAHAGSLQKLAMFPASTIQILGAEKALFRYKKEGGKPPKHGVIYQHPKINTAPQTERGKIARLLATKIAIAAKADAFTKHNIVDTLKETLEKQLTYRKKQQS